MVTTSFGVMTVSGLSSNISYGRPQISCGHPHILCGRPHILYGHHQRQGTATLSVIPGSFRPSLNPQKRNEPPIGISPNCLQASQFLHNGILLKKGQLSLSGKTLGGELHWRVKQNNNKKGNQKATVTATASIPIDSVVKVFMFNLHKSLGAVLLVGTAIAISFSFSLGLEGDLLLAISRAFVQLTALGFVLKYVFEDARTWSIFAAVTVMMAIAGYTAGQRAKRVPKRFQAATSAVALTSLLTLFLIVVLRVFPVQPRYFIPIAGMVIGNTMTITGMTMQRLRDDLRAHSGQVEAALALGANPWQATGQQVRRSLSAGLGPSIDYTKTVGIITLPGAMTGMILGGAAPQEAVSVQIVVLYLLTGAAAFAALTSVFFSLPNFFTKHYQLIPVEDVL